MVRCGKLLRGVLVYGAVVTPGLCQEEAGAMALIPNMESRLSYLEGVIADLRGKVEEMEKKLQDIPSSPLAARENAVVGSSPSLSVAPQGSLPEGAQPVVTPTLNSTDESQKLYDKARAFLNKQTYREAELAFKDLIALYPQSPLVINSKYWLGEIYLSRADYDKASVSFAAAYALYKNQPKRNEGDNLSPPVPLKAAESLLKLAFALRGQGKNEDVCTTLQQLKKEFPDIYSAKKTLVERAQSGLKCSN